jgi:hypothetical protein
VTAGTGAAAGSVLGAGIVTAGAGVVTTGAAAGSVLRAGAVSQVGTGNVKTRIIKAAAVSEEMVSVKTRAKEEEDVTIKVFSLKGVCRTGATTPVMTTWTAVWEMAVML